MAETLPTLTWTSPAAEQLDRQEFTATRGESIIQPFSRSSSSTKDISGHTVTVRFAATNRSQTSLKVTATVSSASEFSVALTDTHLTTLPARTWYWQAFDETDKELLSYGTFVLFENFDLADDGTIPLASLYVPTSRTISINGTSYDLSENRSWTISASSAWADITGKPTTLSGYGITDAASDAELALYLPLAGGIMTGPIQSSGGNDSANFETHKLTDGNEADSVDWEGRFLSDSTSQGSVNWQDRELLDVGGGVTLDWTTKELNTAFTIGGKYIYRADGTDVAVADGGTGRSSHTAYAVLCGGTTTTGAQQSLAVGATTEILVGGGAGALPVWTAATGSGAPVRATNPTLTTPDIGAATGTSITGTTNIIIKPGPSSGGNAVKLQNDVGTDILAFSRDGGFYIYTSMYFLTGNTHDIGALGGNNSPRNINADTQVSAPSVWGIKIDNTTGVARPVTVEHRSNDNAGVNGDGAGIEFKQKSSTTNARVVGYVDGILTDATDASRKGALILSAVDSAGTRECLRLAASGTAAQVGFYGATPVAKPTVTGSRGANAALASLLTALASLGLITDSSS